MKTTTKMMSISGRNRWKVITNVKQSDVEGGAGWRANFGWLQIDLFTFSVEITPEKWVAMIFLINMIQMVNHNEMMNWFFSKENVTIERTNEWNES